MVASSGAFHRPHRDCSGLGTYVRILQGAKLWWIATGFKDGSEWNPGEVSATWESMTNNRKTSTRGFLKFIEALNWEVVFLGPGSTL